MIYKFFTGILFSLTTIFTVAYGQGEKELLKELMAEDRSAVDAIVLYPEDIRNDIFEVSTHPELLIKLSGLQEKTKTEISTASGPVKITGATGTTGGDWIRKDGWQKKKLIG